MPRASRRHLRGIGLQGVVQRIEAEPDRGDGERREPPGRADRQHEIGHAEQHAAEDRKPRLPEQVHQLLHRGGVEQAADAERADDQPDRGEAQAEAQMQIGADIGEGAPADARSR